MNEKEKREELKMEVLDNIPLQYEKLRQVILRRRFSEEELKKILRTAKQMRLMEKLKQDFENYKEQVADPFLGIPPGKHDMPE